MEQENGDKKLTGWWVKQNRYHEKSSMSIFSGNLQNYSLDCVDKPSIYLKSITWF